MVGPLKHSSNYSSQAFKNTFSPILCFLSMHISNHKYETDRVRIIKLKKIKVLHWIWGKGFNWFIFAFLSDEIKQPFAIKTRMGNTVNCIQGSSLVIFSMKLYHLVCWGKELHFNYKSPGFYCNHSLLKATFFLFKAERCILHVYYNSQFGANMTKGWGNYEALLTQMKWVWERWLSLTFPLRIIKKDENEARR